MESKYNHDAEALSTINLPCLFLFKVKKVTGHTSSLLVMDLPPEQVLPMSGHIM